MDHRSPVTDFRRLSDLSRALKHKHSFINIICFSPSSSQHGIVVSLSLLVFSSGRKSRIYVQRTKRRATSLFAVHGQNLQLVYSASAGECRLGEPSRLSHGNSCPRHTMAERNRRPLAPAAPVVSTPITSPTFRTPQSSTQVRRNITTACRACRRRRSKVRGFLSGLSMRRCPDCLQTACLPPFRAPRLLSNLAALLDLAKRYDPQPCIPCYRSARLNVVLLT